MVNICPHCGSTSERPIIFGSMRQRIFSYIWDNPNCTNAEIRKAVYGSNRKCDSVVSVHLSRIAEALLRTEYALVRSPVPAIERGMGGTAYRYKIVYRQPTGVKKELENGTV